MYTWETLPDHHKSRWLGFADRILALAHPAPTVGMEGLLVAVDNLLPHLPGKAEMLDYASLNDGRASSYDSACVRLREARSAISSLSPVPSVGAGLTPEQVEALHFSARQHYIMECKTAFEKLLAAFPEAFQTPEDRGRG
jgi:hypothetical protein